MAAFKSASNAPSRSSALDCDDTSSVVAASQPMANRFMRLFCCIGANQCMASAYRTQTPRINNMTDRSVRDRPDLGQLVKNCCVRTIRFPDWTSGIAPQVHCAHVLKTATHTTTHQLFEHF